MKKSKIPFHINYIVYEKTKYGNRFKHDMIYKKYAKKIAKLVREHGGKATIYKRKHRL